MRRSTLIALAGLVLMAATITAFTSTDNGPPTRTTGIAAAKTVIDVGAYLGDGRTDSEAIQAAIDDARPGYTVAFPGGTYDLDQPFQLKSEVNYVGRSGGRPPRLLGQGSAGMVIEHTEKTPLTDVTIRGLTFDNVMVRLEGSARTRAFSNISIVDSVFVNGATTPEWESAYIELSYTEGVTVDGCQFLRDKAHGGRGIIADRTALTVITDSYFGTTPDLEAGVPNGYFRTAINLYGHDLSAQLGNREIVIDGNVIRRKPGASDPAACWFCQDHGIYAWGSQRLTVKANRVDGWDVSSAGGSMKIRNQEDTFIVDNYLQTSGVLTYVYDSSVMPLTFSRISIRDNVIDLDGQDSSCGSYCGVTYWRDFPDEGDFERDIVVANNRFVDGGSITVSRANGAAFCVEDNVGARARFIAQGVRTKDCSAPASWDESLAGVHRGDFNGDGAEDFIHVARDDDGRRYWRAHMTNGNGYDVGSWGRDIRTSKLTPRYDVHVGDFNGDGMDDLVYYGYCGDEAKDACWRMNLSERTHFGAALDFGGGIRDTAETAAYGVHAGDFDGDGRTDLTLRGSCGNDNLPCWRILRSTPAGFAPIDAGDEVRWNGPETRDFGILVGDFNGDGKDDLSYRGVCGLEQAPCFRVHLGGRSGFTATDWSNNMRSSAGTVHFGLRADDVNGDGRSDISYVAPCGEQMKVQWRLHLSTGSGFAVRCSPTTPPVARR